MGGGGRTRRSRPISTGALRPSSWWETGEKLSPHPAPIHDKQAFKNPDMGFKGSVPGSDVKPWAAGLRLRGVASGSSAGV